MTAPGSQAGTSPLLRSSAAPAPRTLVDVFRATATTYPYADAIDTGTELLTYADLERAADDLAGELNALGIGRGDKVGIRIRSGTSALYVAILGTLLAGAAYVPVDADDPDERARLVFGEAQVAALIGDDLALTRRAGRPATEPVDAADPGPEDDAWVIFTSGSTGTPKGVAVTHRNAAAFVDAEARMFLQDDPVGPGDRVMAGLSVAFDASCEELWLAWGHGACLVPAPRSLVRSAVDVGAWLVANRITIVSTVPTLVSLWPTEALDAVRLLIMGGEACPPEIGARLARPGRELWNTYGPTEATVVACGGLLSADGPVTIGLPLDGWDLAVVDAAGHHVAEGEVGELIIGGVGLARYLDPEMDARKYAPMPTLGWDRAYRSGDRVRYETPGLVFAGRADDQIKLGGRRIELGEIDSALLRLPGVQAAGAAIRRTPAGNDILVGYVAVDDGFDPRAARDRLRSALPETMVPRLVQLSSIPSRTSGKIDRDALPWPPPAQPAAAETTGLTGVAGWIAQLWGEILGATVTDPKDDFFDLGGGSLAAAQMVSRLRARYPEVSVADVYERPTVAQLASLLDGMDAPATASRERVRPTRTRTRVGQLAATVPLRTIPGLRWLTWLGLGSLGGSWVGIDWLPGVPVPLVALGWLLLIFPLGRMCLAAGAIRVTLRGLRPGAYRRGGRVHLRIWLAEQLADELGAANLSGAAWMPTYARLLGAEVGRDVDLHTVPPVTGMLRLGDGSSIEPEVDLAGYWVDGDTVHVGEVRVGARARVGTRSMLLPGARVRKDAEVAPGSAVFGTVPAGEFWSGSPASYVTSARGPWSPERPRRTRRWVWAYAASAVAVALIPVAGILAGLLVALPWLRAADSIAAGLRAALLLVVPATLVGYLVMALLAWLTVRVAGAGMRPGPHPVHSRPAWQAWVVTRTLDECRTWLFPLYASTLTPAWLRALGARVGSDVEASTVLLIPQLTTVDDQAFLADDTLLGGYELGGGYLRVEPVKVGKRAFLGNSGMAAPGRKVPREALVGVLSAAPRRKGAKAGSSWLGSPPVKLRRARQKTDAGRTYEPPRRLRAARAAVEACRLLPVLVHVGLGVLVAATMATLASVSLLLAAVVGGLVLLAAGGVAALTATAAKWLLVGRHHSSEHPLWSTYVWRNELADAFVEIVAAPWFTRSFHATAVFNWWLRSLGASIGKGVWCESYWLPEADLITLHDGATVNRGCVLQTHLFHDRVMSLGRVVLRHGASLGPNSVVLPAAVIGRHASVGPVSLVMRGESVPDKTAWTGNPIGPWVEGP